MCRLRKNARLILQECADVANMRASDSGSSGFPILAEHAIDYL